MRHTKEEIRYIFERHSAGDNAQHIAEDTNRKFHAGMHFNLIRDIERILSSQKPPHSARLTNH